MLDLITNLDSRSDLEAQQSSITLHERIQDVLQSNQDLSNRLQRIENSYDSKSVLARCSRSGTITHSNEDKGNSLQRFLYQTSNESTIHSMNNSFEIDLNTSRVYKRTQLYTSDVSFTSASIRTHAWSVFTGMSLSQVSNISALALPLSSEIIFNNEWSSFVTNSSLQNRIAQPVPLKFGGLFDRNYRKIKVSQPKPRSLHSKVMVLGDIDCGKMELARGFLLGHDRNKRYLTIDGAHHYIEINQDFGAEEYTSIIDHFIQNSEAFLLAFSITSRSQWNRISRFHDTVERIKRHRFEQELAQERLRKSGGEKNKVNIELTTTFILVGTRCHSATDREVSVREGRMLARGMGCQYLEVSSETGENVDHVFCELVKTKLYHQKIRLAIENQKKTALVTAHRSHIL